MNNENCPICETGILASNTHTGVIRYKDRDIQVPDLEYSQCESCGADPVLDAQAKRNQVRYADAKRTCDKLLSALEIREARRYLGLTQHAASSVFGGGLNAFSKYERGEVIQSEAMDKLIRASCHFSEVWNFLRMLADSERDIPLILKSREPVKICDSEESFTFTPDRDVMLGKFRALYESNRWEDQGQIKRAA